MSCKPYIRLEDNAKAFLLTSKAITDKMRIKDINLFRKNHGLLKEQAKEYIPNFNDTLFFENDNGKKAAPNLAAFARLEEARANLRSMKLRQKEGNWDVNSEGDVKMIEEIDYLPLNNKNDVNKYFLIQDKTKKNLNDSYKTKAKLEKEFLNAPNKEVKKELSLSLNKINKKIKALNDQYEKSKKFKNIEQIKLDLLEDIVNIETILKKDNVSFSELGYLEHTVNFWTRLLNFKNLQDVDTIGIFTKDIRDSDKLMNGYVDLVSGVEIKGFNTLKRQLENAQSIITSLQQESALNDAKKHGKADWTLNDILAKIIDVKNYTGNLMDISRFNVPLASTLFNIIKKANYRGYLESSKELLNIDELFKLAESSLKKYSKDDNLFNIFFQKNDKGELTGRLTFRFNQSFFDTKAKEIAKAKSLNTTEAWNNFNQWKVQNEITFDVRKLFPINDTDIYQYKGKPFSEEDKQEHIDKLKEILGKKDFDKYYKWIESKITQFQFDYELQKDKLDTNSELSENEKENLLLIWDKENSPYYYAETVNDGHKIMHKNTYINNKGYVYTKSIPKLDKWFDPNYKTIQSDENLSNLYDKFFEILDEIHDILPQHELEGIGINSIPLMKKEIIEKLVGVGMNVGLTKAMYDSFVEQTTTNESQIVSLKINDISTGKPYREIRNNIYTDNFEAIKSTIELQKLEYKNENGKLANSELIKEWKETAIDKFIKKEQSLDLLKTMKVAALKSFTYKQRALVEDNVKIIETVINNLEEAAETGSGGILKNKALNPIATSKGLSNIKSAVEHHLNGFYNNPLRNKELISDKKRYTTEEKKQLLELEELEVSNNLTADEQIKVTELKNKLGKNINRASYIDGLIKWTYYKLLGWNIPSGIANIGIGQISNYIEASAGLLFNTKQLNKSFILIKNNKENIQSLAKYFDVLKESANELIEERRLESSNKLRLLAPFELQKKGEWLNQIPMFIAMLQNEKYKNTNLYEILKDGDLTKVDSSIIENFKIKVDQSIKKVHGNYDPESLTKVKASVYGRVLIQFRSFMSEAFANRMEGLKYDAALGMDRKGRYRSYTSFTNLEGLLFITKQLGLKLLFQDTQFNDRVGKDGFTELDAANMRANMTELMIIIATTLFMLALSAGDDDDDKKRNFTINFFINQGLRMQNDLLMFSNPMTIESMSKNIVPLVSTLTDANKWRKDVWKFINNEDELKTGLHRGDSRLFRSSIKMLPVGNSILKLESNLEQNFEEIQSR